jgi:hypothetical protein
VLGFSPIADNPLASLILSTALTLAGQTATLSQASLSVTADSLEVLVGETALYTTQNSVGITAEASYTLIGQALSLSQNSVSVTAEANYTLIGQALTLTQKPVVVTADANYTLGSQNLHLTLHSMRMWNKIDPSQNANWTSINTTQTPTWTEIPT